MPWRLSIKPRCCYFFAGFISAIFTMALIYLKSESYNSMRSAIASDNSLLSQKTSTPDQKNTFSFSHLQPLRRMFTNEMQKRRDLHAKQNNSVCVSMAPADFSNLEELEQKEKVLLLIVVSTAPSRKDRRAAIRETWWSKCQQEKIACKFFTDGLRISNEEEKQLAAEKRIHKDIEFQPILGGRTFGLRYLYHIMWASAKYDFSYLLRIDDDYFVCIERLLHELHHRPGKMLKWGWYHCAARDLIFADESWTLFSYDVIARLLLQDPHQILCHPHAGQQIPIWINKVYNKNENLIHFDDRRLHHHPQARTIAEKFKSATRVCDSFMGIHGCSLEQMYRFWNNSNDAAKDVTALTDISHTCNKPNVFKISFMTGPYNFKLRPCIENPQWTPEEKMWSGIRAVGDSRIC